LTFEYFSKIAENIQSDKNNGYFTRVPIYIFDHIAQFFLELEMFQSKLIFRIQLIFIFLKSCRLRDNVQKYIRAAQATDDNMAHARYALDTKGYEHRLSEYVILVAFPLQHWLHERASL